VATSQFLPFMTIDASTSTAVRFEAWHLDDLELPTDLAEKGWVFDPETEVRFHRYFSVAPSKLAEEIHQGSEAEFALVVKVWSSHTRLRSHYDIVTFGASESDQKDLILLEIPNTSLGGRLEFSTRLVLRHPDPIYTFAASQCGSIIYDEVVRQDMEGMAALFPRVEAQDLEGFLGIAPGPPWMIDVQSVDLQVDKTQAITLSINSSSETGVAIIERRQTAKGDRTALLADLYRRIVDAALNSEDYEAEVDAKGREAFKENPRSLGRLMYTTLALCGLPIDAKDARALRAGRPHEFEARILNHSHKVLTR